MSATGSNAETGRIVMPVPSDAPPCPNFHSTLGKPNSVWTYRDAQGRILGHVQRWRTVAGKEIRPLTLWDTDGRLDWRWKTWPERRPLYGLDCIAARPDAPVLIVEGEKAADAAAAIFSDHIAITSPGGALAAKKADWSPLKGRAVVIWPDADEAGERYAADVAAFLSDCGAASVAIVAFPKGLPDGWDLADTPPDGMTQADLARLLAEAAPVAKPTKSESDAAETTDQAAARLAKLSRLEYDRVRKTEAARFGVRTETLDKEVARLRGDGQGVSPGAGRALCLAEPEPWHIPVDGAALLDGIRAIFQRHLILPDHAGVAIALWVLHTYVLETTRITPRLAILSPEKRCGKTTLLSILKALCCKPLLAAHISASAMFRTIEAARPTLLIDEADTFVPGNEDLRNIVNSGHYPNGSVIRSVGEDHEPRQFSTFAPVAIAAIGGLPDTILDRSVVVSMGRRGKGESIESWREDNADDLEFLGRQAARWAADNRAALAMTDPATPGTLNDRAADNWRILFAIANCCGGDWPTLAREAAIALSAAAETDASSIRTLLVSDLRDIFEASGSPALASATICGELVKMEHRPWPEYRKGKPISPKQLASLLASFKIRPAQIWHGNENVRGYQLSGFADTFARYLGDRTAKTLEPAFHKGSGDISSARTDPRLADRISRQPNYGTESSGLAAPTLSSLGDDNYEREERAAIMQFDGQKY